MKTTGDTLLKWWHVIGAILGAAFAVIWWASFVTSSLEANRQATLDVKNDVKAVQSDVALIRQRLGAGQQSNALPVSFNR